MGFVDFHTHILPGVDDGSKSIEQSLAMLRMEAKQGISKVVLTPHFYANHDSPKRFFERRRQAEELLRGAISAELGLPELLVGAEVHYFEGISDSEFLPEMAIRGTNAVMIEMPMSQWSDRMFGELEGIYQKRGLTPIVAHIDRYIRPWATHGLPERLAELPVIVQANANFFQHRLTRGQAIKLLKQRKIHILGSDCHNTETRLPNLGESFEVIRRYLGEEGISYVDSQANGVLCGNPLSE